METNIDQIFSNFSDEIVQKQLYQRAMKAIANKELEELSDYYEKYKDDPRRLELKEGHNMIFYDAKNGDIKYYAQIQRSVEERIRSVYLHKNKQYQWLLAEVHEAFEDFLEAIYAFVGMIDPQIWPMEDFGEISLDEIPQKDFTWFQARVKDKRDLPGSILNQFRKKFPEIQEIEKSNHFKLNLRISIEMIEQLRHVIVHKSGVVQDKEKFFEKILTKSGLWQNGKPNEQHIGFLKSFFLGEELSNHVSLLEIRVHPEIPLDVHIDRFELLVGHVMAYSSFIVDQIRKHEERTGA